jgi:hypothetical protein
VLIVRLGHWIDQGRYNFTCSRFKGVDLDDYTTRKTLTHGPIICGALRYGAP